MAGFLACCGLYGRNSAAERSAATSTRRKANGRTSAPVAASSRESPESHHEKELNPRGWVRIIRFPHFCRCGAGAVRTDFVNKVAISDMFEIQSSQLALSKQPDNDTKPFAQRMVTDHQKTSKELKSLVDGGKVKAALPSALDAEHQKMLDDLKAKNGKDFDQSYDQIQVKAHQDAVALFKAYAAGGDDPELKRWAAKTLPNLERHLTMAEKLK
jgi:putative membrane protein